MPIIVHPFNRADLLAAMAACGEKVPTFARNMRVAKTGIYKMLTNGQITDEMLGRINKYLASKHVPLLQVKGNGHAPAPHLEEWENPLPKEVRVIIPADQPAKGGRKQMVPSGFLMGSLQRLGISQTELSRLTGASLNSIQHWIKTGFCPLWFRAAVNGLMAEAQEPENPKLKKLMQTPAPWEPRKAWQKRLHESGVLVPQEDTSTQPLIVVPLADLGRAITLLASNGINVTVVTNNRD